MRTAPASSAMRYGNLAGLYDALDFFHYGNVCKRSRLALLHAVPHAPVHPLIVGCGEGDFSAELLRTFDPPALSICDTSEKMLRRAARRIASTGWRGELHCICADAATLPASRAHDFVSINYVLNLFEPAHRVGFVKSVLGLLSDGGILYATDFTKPRSKAATLWALCSWYALSVFFYAAASSPVVPLGDIRKELGEAGLEVLHERSFVAGMYGTFLCRAGVSAAGGMVRINAGAAPAGGSGHTLPRTGNTRGEAAEVSRSQPAA